jgi:asparagine synthase (glutamine-hydrolysing)
MCGLAGLIHLDGAPAGVDDERAVRAMCDVLAYRGPDDAGVKSVGSACLGSRRLAIIDLSPAGHMPMSDETGRWWIAYNGEAYNFAAVRAELERTGATFRSHSDTEVVLKAWIAWGPACLDRFVGMFAFALYDRQESELFLVRDRFGVKPLYWIEDRGRILFASEIKALMAQRSVNAVDHRSLGQWWLYRNVDALTESTLIDGIRRLMPGHIAQIRNGQFRASAWYSTVDQVDEDEYRRQGSLSEEEVVAQVESQLDEAVQLRLVSDVPVGTLLSGGLDSSLVTAMAARHSDRLSGFHISIAGNKKLDERRYAEALTDKLRIPFYPFELTPENFRANLARVTWLEDMPLTFANSVGYFLICEVARRHGTIVVLTGEGADETFGGYMWNYRRRMMLSRLKPWYRLLPERLHEVLSLLVYLRAGLPATAHRFRDLMPMAVNVLDRYVRADAQERCEAAYGFLRDDISREVSGSMLADLSIFLTPLLRRLDRNSMGASVEARVPFLDHRLVQTAVNLPLKWRTGRYTDKWILKQIARRYLPPELVWRRKMGFPLPLEHYIAPLAVPAFFAKGFCESVLGLTSRGIERMLASDRRSAHGLFSLVGLEIWGRIFLMGESQDTITQRVESLAGLRNAIHGARPVVAAGRSRLAH